MTMDACPYCQGEDGCDFVGSSRPHDMDSLTVADWGELYGFLRQVYLPFVHKLLARAEARGPVTVRPEVRPEVQAFARAMEEQLRAHDDKGGWKNCGSNWLWARVQDEMLEVDAARRGHGDLLHECADAANFLMMLCDVWGLLPSKAESKT